MRPRPVPSLLDLSSRQHRRRFQAAAGIPPKLYARIRRFQHVLGQIGRVPVADAAAACGYCDQSHLIRDFREFAGTSPGQWLRDRGDVLFLQDAVEAEALL
jgi:AraC-like DNA-binding protein